MLSAIIQTSAVNRYLEQIRITPSVAIPVHCPQVMGCAPPEERDVRLRALLGHS